jgi:hypothetical protein
MNILQYKDIPVYVMSLFVNGNEETFFFTKIPLGDLQRIRHYQEFKSIPITELEDQIFREYTLPQRHLDLNTIDQMPGGAVSTVAQTILRLSEPGTWPDIYGNVREEDFHNRLEIARIIAGSDIELQMMTIICSVFKGYTFEALKKLPFDSISQLFACAERHLIDIGAFAGPMSFERLTLEEAANPKPLDSEEPLSIEEAMLAASQRVNTEGPQMLSDPSKPAIEVKPKATSEEERQKQVEAAEGKRGYVQPSAEHSTAVIDHRKGTTMQVPGIDLSGGFTEDDWNAPQMSDEEALAEAAHQYDLLPAGIEYIQAREEIAKRRAAKAQRAEARRRPQTSLKQAYKEKKRKESR